MHVSNGMCAWARGFSPEGMQWWNLFGGPLSTIVPCLVNSTQRTPSQNSSNLIRRRTLTWESLGQVGENPWAHAHHCWSHASHITHHVHCDCLAPQYWEYYPNIRLCYIGHPCHSSDFWRTPKPKLSSKQNWNLAAVWGLRFLGNFQYCRFAWSVHMMNGTLVHPKYGLQWARAFMMASSSHS